MKNLQYGCHAIDKVNSYQDGKAFPATHQTQPMQHPCDYCCYRKYDRIYRPSACRCEKVTDSPFGLPSSQPPYSTRRSKRRGEVSPTTIELCSPTPRDFGEDIHLYEQEHVLHNSDVLGSSQASSSVYTSETLENGGAIPNFRPSIQLRSSDECQLPDTNERLPSFVNSSKSAPQLCGKHCTDSFRQRYDALYHFHSRYYNKLCYYMAFVLGRFPLPVGISFCQPKSPWNTTGTVAITSVWLDRCIAQTDLEKSRNFRANNQQKLQNQHSTETRLILHFACSTCNQFCLYPGHSAMSCFDVETKHAVLWMHLLVLSAQVQCGHPLGSQHPLMQSLRQSWTGLVASHLGTGQGSSQGDFSYRNHDGTQAQQRPASMNLDNKRGSRMNISVSGHGGSLKKRSGSWHSIRLRSSRRQLRKVNSFFLLATRAYPKVVDLRLLEQELREHHVFDVFRLDSPGDNGELESQWNCLYCTNRPSNAIVRAGHQLRIDELTSRTCKTQSSSMSFPLAMKACTLNYQGNLLVRHVPAGSRRLGVWATRWRLQEFRLRHDFLQWAKPSAQPNQREHPPSGSDVEEDNCCSCTSIRPLKINAPVKIRKEAECIQIPITSVSNVCGVRKKRTGTLEQLEINTDVYGKWRMKPAECQRPKLRQTPMCDSVNRLTSPEPDSQSVTGSDQLTIWMQFLQIALARANQATEWQEDI